MEATIDPVLNQLNQHAWCQTTERWVDESNLTKPHEYFCRLCQKNFWGGIGPGSITDHCQLPKHLNKLANYAPQARAPGEPARKIANAPAPLPQILAVQSRSRSPIRRQELHQTTGTSSKSSPHPRLQPIAFVAETETSKVSIPQPPPPPARLDPIGFPPFVQPPFMQPPWEPHPQDQAAFTMPGEHTAEDMAMAQYRPMPLGSPELREYDGGPEGYTVPGYGPTRTNLHQMMPEWPRFQAPAPRFPVGMAGMPISMPMATSGYRHGVSPIAQPPMQTSGHQIVYVPILIQMPPQPMSTHSGLQVLPFFPQF